MVGSVGHQLYTENGWKMDEGWKERERERERVGHDSERAAQTEHIDVDIEALNQMESQVLDFWWNNVKGFYLLANGSKFWTRAMNGWGQIMADAIKDECVLY